jgi:sarcosine oxidase subunit gamma
VPNDFLRQSPLAHLGIERRAAPTRADGAGVSMAELPFRAMVALRGRSDDPRFLSAVKQALGPDLPLEAGSTSGDENLRLLWLGPDEWWAVARDGGPELAAKLKDALQGVRSSVVDVSEAHATIEIAGPRSRDVLMKGCPLDLHSRLFGPGQCTRSLIAKAECTLLQLADEQSAEGEPAYQLIVRRSFAEYVWCWLEDAAREYGVTVVAG